MKPFLVTFPFLLLTAHICWGARVSQRLIGGHVKTAADDTPEERKTLSQQVAEGKYGLIQKELFAEPPPRPGLLSYDKNAEVPKDDENSLGGLGHEEIWLAENHLLVLKGGTFHRTASELPWPPIDDYNAPNRQVKIPLQPHVPPPFPVQLAEGGPLQFLGINTTRALEGTHALSGPGAPSLGEEALAHQNPADFAPGRTPDTIPPYFGAGPENFHRGNGPGPFPFPFPPPLNRNQSLDEDDPSIYYPPPYSFYYPRDNTTQVPPGPLVPGIILPPPPDFFAPLEPSTTTPKSTTITISPPPPEYFETTPPSKNVILDVPKPTKGPPVNYYLPYNHPTTSQPSKVQVLEPLKPTKAPPVKIYLPYNRPTTTLLPIVPSKVTKLPPSNYYLPYDQTTALPEIPSSKVTKPPTSNYYLPQDLQTTVTPEVSTSKVTKLPISNYYLPRDQTTVPPEIPSSKSTKPPPSNYYLPYDQTTTPPVPSKSTKLPPNYYLPYDHPTSKPTKLPPPNYYLPYNNPTTTLSPVIPSNVPPSNYYLPYNDQSTISPPAPTKLTKVPPGKYYIPYNQPTTTPNTIGDFPESYEQENELNNGRKLPFVVQRIVPPPTKMLPPPYAPPTPVPITYLRPTRPLVHITIGGNKGRKPHPTTTTPPSPILRVPYSRPPIRTYVSSTAVPLKGYFNSLVESNSVQPQAEYYFYEEDLSTPATRLVAPSNFERHIQQIKSYLKPSAKPIYEFSFQAANYHPTTKAPLYLTPASALKTPNHYYTKQDERLLDDITKKYFGVFGQKITTPVTPAISLASDTLVNYQKPHAVNPQAEYINVRAPKQHSREPSTFISYQLPGEGAHFYFLTPQLVQQQPNKGYYYAKRDNTRIPRRNQR